MEPELLELHKRAAGDGVAKGVHTLFANLITSKRKMGELHQGTADKGGAEGFHALIAELVGLQVELF
eukprot:3779520-Prymnesium_polylepis.2